MNAKIISLFRNFLFEFEFYILISSRHTWISWPLAFLLKGGKESHVDEVSMRYYYQFQNNKISTFRFNFFKNVFYLSAFSACFHFEKFYMYFFIKISALFFFFNCFECPIVIYVLVAIVLLHIFKKTENLKKKCNFNSMCFIDFVIGIRG